MQKIKSEISADMKDSSENTIREMNQQKLEIENMQKMMSKRIEIA